MLTPISSLRTRNLSNSHNFIFYRMRWTVSKHLKPSISQTSKLVDFHAQFTLRLSKLSNLRTPNRNNETLRVSNRPQWRAASPTWSDACYHLVEEIPKLSDSPTRHFENPSNSNTSSFKHRSNLSDAKVWKLSWNELGNSKVCSLKVRSFGVAKLEV